jgi:uncharacterized membrane protein YqhA
MFERILTSSRYMILVGVIGSLIAALSLLLYGGLEVIRLLVNVVRELSLDGNVEKTLILSFIDVIELFLLGTAFYIIALGLYELFINDRIVLPAWLQISDFDDLKAKLINVLVVVLGVLFLGQAAIWKDGTDLLVYGISIAAVIAALAYFQGQKSNKSKASPSVMTDDAQEH